MDYTQNKQESLQDLQLRLRESHERKEAVTQYWVSLSLLAVPLLSAAVPAFLTGNAIAMFYPELLHINPWAAVALGIIAGAAIELLGIASVDNAFTIWAWNQRVGDDEKNRAKRAPAMASYAIVGFYLLAVLLLVVMLKVWPGLAIWSLVPLSCLGVISAASLALRKQHNERVLGVGQWAKATVNHRQNGGNSGGNEGVYKGTQNTQKEPQIETVKTASTSGNPWGIEGLTRIQNEALLKTVSAVKTGQITSDRVLGDVIGKPEETARRYRQAAEKYGLIYKNGDGRYHEGPVSEGQVGE